VGKSLRRSSRRSSTTETRWSWLSATGVAAGGAGVEVNDRLFEVHTFRDGQCVRKVDFRERSEALEAAGLEI